MTYLVLNEQLRGLRFRQSRPSLVIMDDLDAESGKRIAEEMFVMDNKARYRAYWKHKMTYHAPKTDEQIEAHKRITELTHALGDALIDICPINDELDFALIGVQKVRMWANASLAIPPMQLDTDSEGVRLELEATRQRRQELENRYGEDDVLARKERDKELDLSVTYAEMQKARKS